MVLLLRVQLTLRGQRSRADGRVDRVRHHRVAAVLGWVGPVAHIEGSALPSLLTLLCCVTCAHCIAGSPPFWGEGGLGAHWGQHLTLTPDTAWAALPCDWRVGPRTKTLATCFLRLL